MFFGLELEILYLGEDGLEKQEIAFGGSTPKGKERLYLDAEGYFDVVYDKSRVKSSGICQSIILDVYPSHHNLS